MNCQLLNILNSLLIFMFDNIIHSTLIHFLIDKDLYSYQSKQIQYLPLLQNLPNVRLLNSD